MIYIESSSKEWQSKDMVFILYAHMEQKRSGNYLMSVVIFYSRLSKVNV